MACDVARHVIPSAARDPRLIESGIPRRSRSSGSPPCFLPHPRLLLLTPLPIDRTARRVRAAQIPRALEKRVHDLTAGKDESLLEEPPPALPRPRVGRVE